MRAMTSPQTLWPRPARLSDSGTQLQPLTSRPLAPDPCPLRQAIPRSPQILTRAAPATRTARRAQHRAAQTAGASVKAPSPELLQPLPPPPLQPLPPRQLRQL